MRNVLIASVVIVAAVSSEMQAQRARPVFHPSRYVQAVCVNIPPYPTGKVVTYQNTPTSGTASTVRVTYIADTGSEFQTSEVTTASSVNSTGNTRLLYSVAGDGLASVSQIFNVSQSQVQGFNITTNLTMTLSPPLVFGPRTVWCSDTSWITPNTTATITATTNFGSAPTQTLNLISGTSRVLSTNESVTVPAGTFSALKWRGVNTAGNSAGVADSFIDKATGIVVKQIVYDADGVTVKSTNVATQIQ